MKRLLVNSLLFYSTLAAIFISISGLLSAPNTAGLLLQLIFLPVTLFLVIESVKAVKLIFLRSEDAKLNKLKITKGLLISSGIYLLLLGLAVKNISKTNRSQEQNNYAEEITSPEDTGEKPGLIFGENSNERQENTTLEETEQFVK